MRAYVRSLNPELPLAVWVIEIGGAVNAVGSGMIMPFNLIYLHNVRGISLAAAGAAFAVAAAASVASGLAAGTIVDRAGGRNTLVGGLLLQATAVSLFPLIRNGWHAAALLGLFGIGTACFWPGQSTLLARLTPPAKRHNTYSLQRISMNLGIGLGGVGGGLIATTARPRSFTWLYVIDACTFFGYIAILAAVREPAEERREHAERASYRDVARDGAFVRLILQNVFFVAAGYEVIALMPVYAKNHAGVAERWIGFVWFANTMLIVLAQLPITKWLEGRRRMGRTRVDERAVGRRCSDRSRGRHARPLDGGGARDDRRRDGLRGRGMPARRDAGRADGGPRPGAPAGPLLRAQRDVVESRLRPGPRRRRPAARLEARRSLAPCRRGLPAIGARLPADRAPASRGRPAHAARGEH
jgi:MFS family permease